MEKNNKIQYYASLSLKTKDGEDGGLLHQQTVV